MMTSNILPCGIPFMNVWFYAPLHQASHALTSGIFDPNIEQLNPKTLVKPHLNYTKNKLPIFLNK